MVNLRMLAIAAAILFGAPVAVAALDVGPAEVDPSVDLDSGQPFDADQHVMGVIEEITLVSPPPPVTGRTGDFRDEQLVEGHTVFVTLDIAIWRNVTEGNITALGNVSCGWETGLTTVGGPFGIPVPRKTQRTIVECRADEHVITTPDPFFDATAANSALLPTGDEWTVQVPSGENVTIREWMFDSAKKNPETGVWEVTRYYAWSTPILDGWTHTDGTIKRFMFEIPERKVWAQDVEHYQIVFGKDVGIE